MTPQKWMIDMKTYFAGFAVAVLLTVGLTLPGHAEDAAASTAPATPAAAQTEAPPSVPRPSLVPKAAEPALPPAAEDTAQQPRRRYAHRYHGRYGYYRTAYWEPFPIYWPHLYHNRIHWNRIPWLFRF
jgi:hypothetical protein